MADAMARRQRAAELRRQAEEEDRQAMIEEIQDAITSEEAKIEVLQAKVLDLHVQLKRIRAGADSPQHQARHVYPDSRADTVSTEYTVPRQMSNETANEASASVAGSQRVGSDAVSLTFFDSAAASTADADADGGRNHNTLVDGSVTAPGAAPARSPYATRKSSAPTSIEEEQVSLLEQLQSKKSSIYKDDDANPYFSISCHKSDCRANMPHHKRNSYANNRYDIQGLRKHYQQRHGISVKCDADVMNLCEKTPLTEADIADILQDKEPSNDDLRDRAPPQQPRTDSKSRASREFQMLHRDTTNLNGPKWKVSSPGAPIYADSSLIGMTSARTTASPAASQPGPTKIGGPANALGTAKDPEKNAGPSSIDDSEKPVKVVMVNGHRVARSVKSKKRPAGDGEDVWKASPQRRARISDSADEIEVVRPSSTRDENC